ncbi:MAG: ribonuclease HII [Deltaproteobacteria bacterium]|nr:ribonuclease HII [Deltaproteobacteria bacterium]
MDLLAIEKKHWDHYEHIAGIDEAGRGAWAGPVCAAAVILKKNIGLPGVDDSKKLTPKKREALFDLITSQALSYGVALVPAEEIDQINILQATKKAMLMAVAQLNPQPGLLLIDGNAGLDTKIPFETVIDGDALSQSIAAASIIAKVTRDRLMIELGAQIPGYGFEKHKGYGTKIHREAMKQHGVHALHRKSYAPVRELL